MLKVNGLITLTTDFDTKDGYVGAMKGVIANIDPDLRILDITHAIPPQDIRAGALCLANATPFYPRGTVHIAVIDPGVGSKRAALVAETQHYFYVLPDNGLLTHLAEIEPILQVRRIDNTSWCCESISNSFHGRDIFAPVGAHLAAGAVFDDVGPVMDSWITLPLPQVVTQDQTCIGEVLDVDIYGNLITNISRKHFQDKKVATVIIAEMKLHGLKRSFAAVPPGELLAMIGSRDCIEIAVNGGNAARLLNVGRGDAVRVLLNPS